MELANNSLSGPAFPEPWLVAGAMPRLALLDVSGNKDLGGALPEDLLLKWTKISELRLGGTSLPGAVPRQWYEDGEVGTAPHLSWKGLILVKVFFGGRPVVVTKCIRMAGKGGASFTRGYFMAPYFTSANLLPLGALVMAAVAGRHLLRQRFGRALGMHQLSSVHCEATQVERASANHSVPIPRLQQRARLTALIQAELSCRGRTLQLGMAPLPASAAVTHQLGSSLGGSLGRPAVDADLKSLQLQTGELEVRCVFCCGRLVDG